MRAPKTPQVFPKPRPFRIAFPCTLLAARLYMFQRRFPLSRIQDFQPRRSGPARQVDYAWARETWLHSKIEKRTLAGGGRVVC